MKEKPVYTFAKWQVAEGRLAEVLKWLTEVTEKSRKEEGNLVYKVHQSNTDANMLLLYEGYADAAAVEAHRNSEYFQGLVIGKIMPLLTFREVILASQVDLV